MIIQSIYDRAWGLFQELSLEHFLGGRGRKHLAPGSAESLYISVLLVYATDRVEQRMTVCCSCS